MSLVNLSSELLWASGAALQVSIVYLCWRRKLHSEYPIFFNYNVFVVLSYAVLFSLYRPSLHKAYFIAYWVSSGIEALLGFGAIYEVFRNAFKPFEALRDLAGVMFRWSALVLALVATILTCTSTGQEPRAMMAILCLERGVMVMQCGLLLFLLLFSSRLGMTWQHHGFGVSLGFGLFAATQLILNSVRSQLGPSWGMTYSLLESASYDAAVIIWVCYLMSPEPARVTVESAFNPKPVLHRWNEVLGGDHHGAFMPSLEKIVDQVLSEER
jgi:hypothetical protein